MNVKTAARFGRDFALLLIALPVVALLAAAPARAIDTAARFAYMIDVNTGTVLLEKKANRKMAPASMSKLMTIYLAFLALKNGDLSLDDKLVVSTKAWRMGGSKMFVRAGSRVKVKDLLRGIIVQSGNDACIVIAEGISGTEKAFAEEMTRKAKELGMNNSRFRNATGWPARGHVMSAKDIAILSQRLILEFPDYYRYFAEKSFTYNKIRQSNRNPLLFQDNGADGLKTGHTAKSGYGLAASAVRDGRRIVLVLNGLRTMRARSTESRRLINWAFRASKNYRLFAKGATVEEAAVWMGAEDTVPLMAERDVEVTLLRRARRKMEAKIIYEGPVPAPIKKGTRIARLVVTAPGLEKFEVPLVAAMDVDKLGPFGRISAALRHMLLGLPG